MFNKMVQGTELADLGWCLSFPGLFLPRVSLFLLFSIAEVSQNVRYAMPWTDDAKICETLHTASTLSSMQSVHDKISI